MSDSDRRSISIGETVTSDINLPLVWGRLKNAPKKSVIGNFLAIFQRTIWAVISRPVGALACFLTLTTAFTICGLTYILLSPLNQLVESRSLQVPLRVELVESVSESVNSKLMSRIEEISGVSSVSTISGEEVFADLQKRLGEDHPLISGMELSETPFSSRILVNIDSKTYRESVGRELLDLKVDFPVIEGVRRTSHLIEALRKFLSFINSASLVLIAAAILGALILVIIALQLRFLLRKDELRIMSFVGATRDYIAAPLYMEAFLLSLMAALISLEFLSLIERALGRMLRDGLGLVASEASFFVLGTQGKIVLILLGVALGLIGSVVTVNFFAKE